MHICFLTNEYPKKGLNSGGIGTFVQFLARKLVEKQISVTVVGINNDTVDTESEDLGVKIYRIRKPSWKFAKFYQNSSAILKKLNEINSNHKIDIVEGSELNFAFFPNNTTYKKVIRLHGGHHFFALELNKKLNFWRAFQEKQSFKKANNFIAVSNYVGRQTQNYLKYNFSFTTIYNSVDTEKFKPFNKSLEKKNVILFIGTVCEKKGVRQLVQAMPLIKQEIPSVCLKIVGRDWFFENGKSYIEYLKGFITEDVFNAIEIVGAVPHIEIPNLISEAEVCVFPSHMEAMPIAWLEALAMGKKVVASNIGPGREAVINNQTGILINPYDPLSIAEGILEILKNKDKTTSLGVKARQDIVQRFNVDKIVKENINFFRKMTNLLL